MQNQWSETVSLKVSDSISLHGIELSDAAAIFQTINTQREYLREWLPFVDFTQTVEDSESFVRSVLDAPVHQRELTFVIRDGGVFAGLIGFKSTDWGNHKTEIGYWLSYPFQKRGIITRSVQRLSEFAFREQGINRIQIKCAVGNEASSRIPKRLGFSFEGIERDGERMSDGTFADIEVYSKLQADPTDSSLAG